MAHPIYRFGGYFASSGRAPASPSSARPRRRSTATTSGGSQAPPGRRPAPPARSRQRSPSTTSRCSYTPCWSTGTHQRRSRAPSTWRRRTSRRSTGSSRARRSTSARARTGSSRRRVKAPLCGGGVRPLGRRRRRLRRPAPWRRPEGLFLVPVARPPRREDRDRSGRDRHRLAGRRSRRRILTGRPRPAASTSAAGRRRRHARPVPPPRPPRGPSSTARTFSPPPPGVGAGVRVQTS